MTFDNAQVNPSRLEAIKDLTVSKSRPSKQAHWLDRWHVNPSLNRDYDFIDGLRGIAILMVIVGHHVYTNPDSGWLVRFVGAISGAGGHGVTLFFSLSGFLISWPFWKRKFGGSERVVPPGYGARRFWKIYPPLALSVVLLTPLYVYMTKDWSYVPIAAKWLAGIPFLFPVSGKLNPVMWTLVVEVQFYITLPLVFLFLKKALPTTCLWLIPSAFFVIPTITHAVTGGVASFFPEIDAHYPCPLDAFALGILMAGLENAGCLTKRWARLGLQGFIVWIACLLVTAWATAQGTLEGIGDIIRLAEIIGSGCLLCYVADPKHPIATLLSAPWLRWCGIISYEWYLFHQPITLTARSIAGKTGGSVVKYAAVLFIPLLLGLALSAIVYRWFSLPILKYGRGQAKANPAPGDKSLSQGAA